MRSLGLDVGTKTIGVAVSDELGITVHGVTTIKRAGVRRDMAELRKIIEELKPDRIVLGVPYLSSGALNNRGERIVDFGERVESEFGIPVVHWDESFSTVEAERFLIEADVSRKKRRKVVDKMAALVILREYLESAKAGEGGGREGGKARND